MHKQAANCISRAKNCLLVLDMINVIFSTFTLIYFSVQLHLNLEYRYVLEYKESACYPVNGRTREIQSCDQTKWIMVWTDSSGRQIVENPFSMRDTRSQAISDRDDTKLFVNRTCMCRSGMASLNSSHSITVDANCQVWEACIFNSDFVKYMQRYTNRYFVTNVSFVVGSSISILLSLIGIPLGLYTMRHKSKEYEIL